METVELAVKSRKWKGYNEPDMDGEAWRFVENFEGLYQVSDLGRVRSVERVVIGKCGRHFHLRQKLLDGGYNDQGYRSIMLCKPGKQAMVAVARLVAKAFIPNPENKEEVNHKSGDKDDNSVNNLEWVTPKENTVHSRSVLKKCIGESNHSKLKEVDVLEIRRLRREENTPYLTLAARYGVGYSTLRSAALGINWKTING